MPDWDESKKFTYESMRMLVVVIIGFIATISIVQPWESSVNHSSFLEKEKIRIKKEVVDDFLRTSYLYASSVYKVMSNDTDLDKNKEAELYELTYRNYRVDLNRMIVYFKIKKSIEHYSLVKKSTNLKYRLRQMYLNKTNKKDWGKLRANFKSVNNKIAELALKSIGL